MEPVTMISFASKMQIRVYLLIERDFVAVNTF
jgi:hypothetical protein